jgi:ferritin-like metal-binding protein YciE
MANTKTKKTSQPSKNSNGGGRSSSNGNGAKRNEAGSKSSNSKKQGNGEQQRESSAGVSSSRLDKFFLDAVKDIYWAEKHLTKALPKMQKAATSEELQQAIEDHLAQTEQHVGRLEQVFELLEEKPQAKKCEAMDGITKEGESVIEETDEGSATRDVGIIGSAQKVEHYEIATYGTLVQLAKTMGNEEVADILAQTLEEEKQADKLLSQIAENNINWEAEEE